MTKGIRRVGITSRAPFKLSRQASAFLSTHREYMAAEQAYDDAGAKEHGKRWGTLEFADLSPDLQAKCSLMCSKRRAAEGVAEGIAARLHAKKRPTLDDVLLLGMAGWHANTFHALCRAVPMVAGIDMASKDGR